jgi:hypothetical protein
VKIDFGGIADMGKASRKMNKKKQKNMQQNQQAEAVQLRDQMHWQEEGKEYAEAIETLAELVEKKLVTAEDMYAGARDYYMIEDYTRSGQCVNSVLTMEPAHIGARILLGKLCLNEERIDDALAIYDFVLSNFAAKLTTEQEEEILESLRYYGQHESERLKVEHPVCYAMLEKHACVQENKEEDSLAKAAAAIARLKEKVRNHEAVSVNIEPISASAQSTTVENAAEQEKQSVMTQNISLMEKVCLLNRFAGAHYYQSDYEGAKVLLTSALELDSGSDMSLRNMAMLLADIGEVDKAVAIAGKMAEPDFVLLQYLRR